MRRSALRARAALLAAALGVGAAVLLAAAPAAHATTPIVDCTGALAPTACTQITPTVCVFKSPGGQVTGVFGYINNSGDTLQFTPNTPYDEVLQVSTGSPHTDITLPSAYPPGTNASLFTYNWPGDKLSWNLGNPANSVIAAGSGAGTSCPTNSVPVLGNVGVASVVFLGILAAVNRRYPLRPLLRSVSRWAA